MVEDVGSLDAFTRVAKLTHPLVQPGFSSVLVVSSVALRDLHPNLSGAPCVLDLTVGRHCYTTELFHPTAAESAGSCVTSLEPLHITFPIPHSDTACLSHPHGVSTFSGASHNGGNGSDHSRAEIEICVHVTLRAASSGTVALGSTQCYASGAWMPLSPCSGSVCVTFCAHHDAACGLPHAEAVPRSASVPLRIVDNRHAGSANGTPMHGTSRCGLKPLSGARACVGNSALMPGTSILHTPSSPHYTLSHTHTHSTRPVIRGTREGQPRNLVFSQFCVGGFLPLAPVGYWQLDFAWTHPQLADMRRTLRLPPRATELRETITVDLPLFLRGEVHTHLSALWRSDADDRPATPFIFEPICVDVQESELSAVVERRQSAALDFGELTVRLRVALEFHKPLREGHNGRPTSAFPQRRARDHCASSVDDGSVEKESEEISARKGRRVPAALWQSRSGGARHVPATFPPMHAVQNLVPCFDEAQRRAVFEMYDTAKRGNMSREQLLHFCRAHVALFAAEQSDVSVLQSLWPYVPDGLLKSAYASDKPTSADGVRPGSAMETRRVGTPPCRSLNRPHSATSTSTRKSQFDSVSYEVFTLIALRLSRM